MTTEFYGREYYIKTREERMRAKQKRVEEIKNRLLELHQNPFVFDYPTAQE